MSKKLIDTRKRAYERKPIDADLSLNAAEALSPHATERKLLQRQISTLRQLINDDRALITELQSALADIRESFRQHGQNVPVNRTSKRLRHNDGSLGMKSKSRGQQK